MERSRQALLVIAAQRGNEEAFTELVKMYQQPLVRFAYRLCGDLALAKDATQDSWLKVARSLTKLSDPDAFKAWLFTAVRHRLVDLQRSARPVEALAEVAEAQAPMSVPAGHSLLDRAGNALSFIDKQCLYLFYTEELTVNEIAQVLSVPAGTVKSRLNRARRHLRDFLQSNGPQRGVQDDEY